MSLTGTFNALNAASALIQVHRLGIDWQTLASHLKKFKTVKRRQEVVFDQNGVLIIDDFAHHPTAVQATLTAIRKKYPAQKIWAVWEPRSATSRRSIFQKEYAEAFRGSDCTVIAKPYDQSKIAENERFSSEALVKSLNDSGVLAKQFDTSSEIASFLLKGIDHNDVILVMSNGGFDGLILKLKEGLS